MDFGGLARIAAIFAVLFAIPSACGALQSTLNPGFINPTPVYTCPEGCTCMTEAQAEVDFDGSYTKCSDTSCGTSGTTKKYCYKEKKDLKVAIPPALKHNLCPTGCECMLETDAYWEFGADSFKTCSATPCGSELQGEFYINKYCYSSISADECVDTDGGKNYAVKGSAPGCEDACSDFSHNPPQVLTECVAELVDGKCKVTTESHDCDSVCEDGKCLPPTCSDWIQNQGETGVDCGGPCTASCVCGQGCKCSTLVEAEQEFGEGGYASCSSTPCGHGWQGDLAVNKYCYKKIESYDCVDTDGANVMTKGSAPGCTDTCLDDRTVQECTVIQNIDTCTVKQSPYKCEGACKDGACQPPTCDDGIKNQDEISIDCSKKSIYSKCSDCCHNGLQDPGEEGVDCGGTDCIPCGWIRVKGRILYEDTDTATGQFKPVRYGTFFMRLSEDGTCGDVTHEAVGTTYDNGKFDFMVPKENFQSVFIQFGDSNDFFEPNYAVRLAMDLDGCNEYVWWTSGCKPLPATGTLDFGDLKIGMNSDIDFNGHWKETTDGICGGDDLEGAVPGGSAYFNIADAILFTRQYVDGKRDDDDSIGAVDIQYPDSDWSDYNSHWA